MAFPMSPANSAYTSRDAPRTVGPPFTTYLWRLMTWYGQMRIEPMISASDVIWALYSRSGRPDPE